MTESRPPGAPPTLPQPPRVLLRRTLLVLAAGAALSVVAVLSLQVPFIGRAVANLVLGHIPLAPGARLSVAGTHGNWVTHLELRGLRLAGGGINYATADTLGADLRPWSLLGGRIDIASATLAGVRLDPRVFQLPRPRPARPAPRLTLDDLLRGRFYHGPRLRIDELRLRDVRGTGTRHEASLLAGVMDSSVRLVSVRLAARGIQLGDGFAFHVDTLGLGLRPGRGEHAGVAVTASGSLHDGRLQLDTLRLASPTSDVGARGSFAYATGDTLPDVWLSLTAAPLDLADLSAFVAARDTGEAAFTGLLRADAALRGSSLDSVTGRVRLDLPRGRVAGLGLEPGRLEAAFERGRADVALDVGVEHAPLTVRGWIRPLDARPEYSFRAAVPRLPARLPGAAWWPDLARRAALRVDLEVTGRGFADLDAELAGSATGEAGALEWQGRLGLGRALDWELRRLAFRDLDVSRLAGGSAASRVRGELRAGGQQGPGAQWRTWARLDLGPSVYDRWSIHSARLRTMLGERGGGASLALDAEGGTLDVDTLSWRLDGDSRLRMRGARLRIDDLAAASGDAALAGHVEATAELEGSGVAHLTSPPGALAALRAGRVRANARVELAPSRIRGRAVRSGRFGLALAGGEATLTGELDSDAGRFTAEAASRPFDARPVHHLRRLRFDAVDLGAWLASPALRSRLAGTVTGELAGEPGSRADAAAPEWRADVRLERGHVGPLALERGEWNASGLGPQARLSGRQGVTGGELSLVADARSDGDASTCGARLEVPFGLLPALLGRDTLHAEGALTLTLDATGPFQHPDRMLASGRVRGRGSVERATVDSLLLAFHLERGVATVDTLALRSNVAAARASGRVALSDPADGGGADRLATLHARLDILDPSRLAPILGADSLSLSSGTVLLDVEGPARERTFRARAELRTLVWDGLRLKRATANAGGRIRRGAGIEAQGRAEAEWMTIGGMRMPSAGLEFAGDSRRVRWSARGALRERDSVTAAGVLEGDSAGWSLALSGLELQADSALWRLARPARFAWHGPRFELDGFEFAAAHGSITARGVLDREGTQDLHVELRDVGLRALAALEAVGELRGALNGTLDVTGPAASPRARGDVQARMHARGQPAGVLGATFDWTTDGADLVAAFTSPAQDSLVLSGRLPYAFTLAAPAPDAPARPRNSGTAALRLRASRFPLRTLQPVLAGAGVGVLDGVLDMDLRLSGRGTDFRGQGGAMVAGGRLELPGLGGKYSEMELQAAWDGDRLVLHRFRALAGKGRLEASGSVRVASLVRAEPDLSVKADRAVLMDTRELKLVASGDLRLRGALGEPVLQGRLSFGGSHLLIAQDTFADPNAKAVIPLSAEDLRTLEETFTYVEPVTPDPLLGLYEASDLDLTVVLERNNWIRQTAEPRISVEIAGEVRLRKRPRGEPELVGRLEPLPGRGYVEQFGRSFALTGGEVLLNGAMASHTLNLRAQYPSERDAMAREENNVVVYLDLQGTLENMRLVLSSEPPLSETEIVTFIATGRSPTTRTGESQSMGSEAVSLGVDMGLAKVSGALEDAAQRSVGLDVLKVGYDGIQGTTLIAGRYVAPQLYVGFRQPLQSLNSNNTNLQEETSTKVEMEYAAYRWLVLNVQGESSFIRSYLRFRREY